MPRNQKMATRRSQRQPDHRRLRTLLKVLSTWAGRIRAGLSPDRMRLGLIGAVSLVMMIALGLSFNASRDGASDPGVVPVVIDTDLDQALPAEPAQMSQTVPEAGPEAEDAAYALPMLEAEAGHSWAYVQVARGDTLEVIFRRLGLSARLLHDIVRIDDNTRNLARLRPGDELAFDIDETRGFRALRAEFDDEHWLLVELEGKTLNSRLEARNLEVRVVEVNAEISSSLFNAGKNAGLSDNMILRLAGIFGWDIDFALDIRRGDRFALVFEEIYRDGQFLRQGAILGARFINQGRSFEAVQFDAGNGPDYFDPRGRPMRKAFLRAPLNFTRVTSNFNPRRFHPVTRRVRPHNGTDYGAPTGTPVWAAGDGKVIEAGYSAANGNYIFIQHGNHIVSRYLHLSLKQVKRGERVRQGQTIGRVGATGMATGPHLHYEFLVHGHHRDPRKVDLPEAEPLPEEKLPEFHAAATPMFAQLEDLLPPRVMLASAGDDESAAARDSRAGATSAPK